MRKTVLRAMASSTDTLAPFLDTLVLPVLEDTPWNAALIRGHENMTTLVHLPAGHTRFVPTNKQTNVDTYALTPVRWPVELVLISNEEGRKLFLDTHRIRTVLAPAISSICHIRQEHHVFFPTAAPTCPMRHAPLAEHLNQPLPKCPAIIPPPTSPREPPRSHRPTGSTAHDVRQSSAHPTLSASRHTIACA
jgi:hypothetical protein